MMGRMGLVALLLCFLGCTQGEAPESVVSGRVTWKGKEIPKGKVYFFSTGGSPPQIAEVSDGRFEAKIRPGKYRVEVRAFKKRENMPEKVDPVAPIDPYYNYIPPRHNDESSREVKIEGGQAKEIELQLD